MPFTGPNGELYVAWNDYAANTIAFSRSFDGGGSFTGQTVISSKTIAFDIAIPAEFNRRALIYPACDADRSTGPHRGRLYCSWVDAGAQGTDVFLSTSAMAARPGPRRVRWVTGSASRWTGSTTGSQWTR